MRVAVNCAAHLEPPDLHDASRRIDPAGVLRRIDSPRFCGFGQFSVHILALVKQRPGVWAGERRRHRHQRVKPGKRPGSDDIGHAADRLRAHLLDPALVNPSGTVGDSRGLAQESDLFSVALDELDGVARLAGQYDGQDQAGKTLPRCRDSTSQARPCCRSAAAIAGCRPHAGSIFRRARRTDQIDVALPLAQQRHTGLEPSAA